MKPFVAILFVSSLLLCNALAHSPLQNVFPDDGAELDAMPNEVRLIFKRNMRLTKITSSHNGGNQMILDLNGQTSFATEFQIPIHGNGSGEYRVHWRGLGDDGHVQKGSFFFKVD